MQRIIREFLETNPTDTEIEEFYITEVS